VDHNHFLRLFPLDYKKYTTHNFFSLLPLLFFTCPSVINSSSTNVFLLSQLRRRFSTDHQLLSWIIDPVNDEESQKKKLTTTTIRGREEKEERFR
jgi:hypothetical protein